MMRIAYDAQADALRLVFAEGEVANSREMARGIIVNLDPDGNAVAVQVLRASQRIGQSGMSRITIDLRDLGQTEGRE